jgi:hypothetical protein
MSTGKGGNCGRASNRAPSFNPGGYSADKLHEHPEESFGKENMTLRSPKGGAKKKKTRLKSAYSAPTGTK